MATTRLGLIAGAALAGVLLLGSSGLVAAQDPSPTPSASATAPSAMMGGSGMMAGSGMSHMDADDIAAMTANHQAMGANGTCDAAQMSQLHDQLQPNR